MFASVLLPFADRGAGPLYHWVMLAQMARFEPQDIVFIADSSYFDEGGVPFGEWIRVGGLRVRCPTRERYQAFRKILIDQELFVELQSKYRGHLEIFRGLLLERFPVLEERLVNYLSEFVERGELEAVLTWCNMPSLRAALDRLGGIPLIHNEIGPLRSPLYRETFYFDFAGVNGHTAASSWSADFVRSQMAGAKLQEIDIARGLLVSDAARVDALGRVAPEFRAGVALQIEDDSNAVAYADGWTTLDLLYDVMGRVGPDRVLVRSHPGAHFKYQGGLGVCDDSSDSLEFLSRVDEVVSINSSVLIEAAFWGRRFDARGDTPARFLQLIDRHFQDPPDWAKLAFNAFFCAYLVPGELLFDPSYYRWRLGSRTLADCHERHLAVLEFGNRLPIGPLTAGVSESADELIRLPPIWTSTLGLEGRLSEASRRLQDTEHDAKSREDELHVSLLAAKDDVSRWRREAEENWNSLEWFKAELTHCKDELERCKDECIRCKGELIARSDEVAVSKDRLKILDDQLTGYARLCELADDLLGAVDKKELAGSFAGDSKAQAFGIQAIRDWIDYAKAELDVAEVLKADYLRLSSAVDRFLGLMLIPETVSQRSSDRDLAQRISELERVRERLAIVEARIDAVDNELKEYGQLRRLLHELARELDPVDQSEEKFAEAESKEVSTREEDTMAYGDVGLSYFRDDVVSNNMAIAVLRRLDRLSAQVARLVEENAQGLRATTNQAGTVARSEGLDERRIVSSIRETIQRLRRQLQQLNVRIRAIDSARSEMVEDAKAASEILSGFTRPDMSAEVMSVSAYAKAASTEFARMQARLAETESRLDKLQRLPGALSHAVKKIFDRGR